MLVYRSDDEVVESRTAWRALVKRADALATAPPHGEITSLLIDFGELEAAVADALFPHRDGLNPLCDAFRFAALALGRLFVASSGEGGEVGPALVECRRALRRISEEALPVRVTRRVSEGYAYYALHPETYSVAARRFFDAAAPRRAVCIGVRSIGTSLSAVVGATLAARGVPVDMYSVRPRGHPFDREMCLDGPLQAALRARGGTAHYLVIDEGPGLSGSSFASTARALTELGIASDRIAFFPSWNADGSTLRCDRARTTWLRHDRWVAGADAVGVGIDATVEGRCAVDWSAGRWRETLFDRTSEWPAVHGQHERVKRLLPEERQMVRFAGLGRYGTLTHTRALILSAGGFAPPPGSLRAGYLHLPYQPGTPLTGATADLLEFVARYAAFVARYFQVERSTPVERLHEMVETNCREADATLHIPPLARFGSLIGSAAVALDARMLRHEFVRTAGGLLKTDALDHASDHFYPGPQDIAWDLAAAEAEFGLDPDGSAVLLAAFVRCSGDTDVTARMPFYRLAYAAHQLGYATLASQSLGDSPDAFRFASRRDAFLARVRALTSA